MRWPKTCRWLDSSTSPASQKIPVWESATSKERSAQQMTFPPDQPQLGLLVDGMGGLRVLGSTVVRAATGAATARPAASTKTIKRLARRILGRAETRRIAGLLSAQWPKLGRVPIAGDVFRLHR